MQLVGKQGEGHLVLRIAADLERATGGTQRHPPRRAGGRAGGRERT